MTRPAVSAWLLFLTVALACGIAVTYAVQGQPLPPPVALLIIYGPLAGILYWLRVDATDRKVSLVYDWGFLALIAWPILIPWYVHRTRGPHGWSLTLWCFLAILGPTILGALIFSAETLTRAVH